MRYLKITFLFFTLLSFSYVSEAATIYVDVYATGANNGTTWKNAYINLQTAIDNANYGDKIHVSEGIYNTTTSYSLKNGVRIYGGFPNATSVPYLVQYPQNRDFMRNPNQYVTELSYSVQNTIQRVIKIGSTTLNNQTLVDGVTLKGKYTLFITQVGTNTVIEPSFVNCKFVGHRNFGTIGDTGIYMPMGCGKSTFKNCHFSKFTKGVYFYSVIQSNPQQATAFIECTFANISLGIESSSSHIGETKIDRCVFYNNDLAISLRTACLTTIQTMNITNSLFYNNKSALLIEGGGNSCYNGLTVLSNCTFVNNGDKISLHPVETFQVRCELRNDSTNFLRLLKLDNCISWNNLNSEGKLMRVDEGVYVELQNTLLEANSLNSNGTITDAVFTLPNPHPIIQRVRNLGGNVFNQNPSFTNPNSTEPVGFKLQSQSPARNTGNNALIPLGLNQAYGNTNRILESNVDMGAYEYCPSNSCNTTTNPILTKISQDEAEDIVEVYPNPVQKKLYIKTNLKIELIEIINIQGQILKSSTDVSNIDVQTLKAGMYTLRIFTKENIIIKRIIKQ